MAKNKKNINVNISEIKDIVGQLRMEFEHLINSNPYLLWSLNKEIKITYKNNKGKTIECDYDPSKFKKRDALYKLLYAVTGFAGCLMLLAILYVFYKSNPENVLVNHEEKCQAVLSFIFYAMPTIILVFSIIISYLIQSIRVIYGTDKFLDKHFVLGIAIAVVVGMIPLFFKWNQELLLFVCPFLGCIAIFISVILVYNPHPSNNLVDTIKDSTEQIQDKLNSINNSIVQESHKTVLERINKVENTVRTNCMDKLLKIQSLTVLDSLRLELIQNSINGINLVEDWKYLDLSQKMIEEIMSCENKRITMVGDLSFLSTEDGLDKLVKAIRDKNKVFDIYFTGEKIDGEEAIKSKHCQELVDNIKKQYSSKREILTKIESNVHLFPILSKSFTGIGFIGLLKNSEDNNIKLYQKVYAYISSFLIPEKDLDITRANPFVFCWSSDQTSYFKEFIHDESRINNNLRVQIDGKIKNRTEILKFTI